MRYSAAVLLLLATTLPASLIAATVSLDFEPFPDSTILTNQYPDLTFTNAIVLTAGITLNEFEFPPHSGVNVVSDNGGAISIVFANPILEFGGYFTYSEPLTLDAFNAVRSLVSTAVSAFSNNLALSGVPGSSPNEFLQVESPGGISKVIITGDPSGGSFALDDARYTTAATVVPEPSSLPLWLTGLGVISLLSLLRSKLVRQKRH